MLAQIHCQVISRRPGFNGTVQQQTQTQEVKELLLCCKYIYSLHTNLLVLAHKHMKPSKQGIRETAVHYKKGSNCFNFSLARFFVSDRPKECISDEQVLMKNTLILWDLSVHIPPNIQTSSNIKQASQNLEDDSKWSGTLSFPPTKLPFH